MNRLFLTALIITIMLLLLPTAQAADIETSDTCTLADAITAANTDEAAGECPAGDGADIISLSGDITLTAALPQITTEITIEGSGFTISGNNRFRIFVVNGGTLTVNNLAMTKGNSDWGGAIVNVNNGLLTINNSSITSSRAAEGGAIGNDSTLTVTNSDISSNSADVGGAIHSIGGILHVTGGSVNSNSSLKYGGAIYHESARLYITNVQLTGNKVVEAYAYGGAIYGHEGSITISGSVFSNNKASDAAGAVYQSDGSLQVETSSFLDNTSGHRGGAIYCTGCELHVANSRISGNFAYKGGGGISARTGIEKMKIVNCTITNNRTAYRRPTDKYPNNGGGIDAVADGTISNCYISHNSSDIGGGIFISRDVEVINSVIADNSAVEDGGGIYVNAYNVILSHLTMVSNKAVQGGGLYRKPDRLGREVMLRNTILTNNEGGDCFGRLNENINNLIADGSCFAVLSGDPKLGELVEPEDGSPAYYPLLEGSPAIDAADDEYCPDTDMLGAARPQGAACDIGAYERPQ